MEQFSHSPLNLDRPAIRLLRLLRGTEPSVECEIFQAYLDTTRDDLIPYEALSYTWGGTERAANVQIDAKNYNVTENLYLALLHLRLPYEDRLLWVDAICIDQSNLRERGHQVGQMGEIYSLASRVLVWLGHGTEETDMFLDSLKELERQGIRSWSLADPRWPEIWSSLQSYLKRQQPEIEQRQSAALKSLLKRPWFKRVWILQEVANAKRATICCGRKSISAHSFALAPSLLKVQLEAHCQAVLDIFPGHSRDNSWWNAHRDLYTLLRKFSDSHASDPRDKIFALLGICSDSDKPDSLVADYTKTLCQVMSQTAMFIFKQPVRSRLYTTTNDITRCAITGNRDPPELHVCYKSAKWINTFFRRPFRASLILDQPSITTNVLEAAIHQPHGKGIVKQLFGQEKISVMISYELFSMASRTDIDGSNALDILHERQDEKLVVGTAKTSPDVMAILLARRGDKVQITTRVLKAAAANEDTGVEMMRLLLKQKANDFLIELPVIETAIKNPRCGAELLTFLLNRQDGVFSITGRIVRSITAATQAIEIWATLLGSGDQVAIADEAIAHLPKPLQERPRERPSLHIERGWTPSTKYTRHQLPHRSIEPEAPGNNDLHNANAQHMANVWTLHHQYQSGATFTEILEGNDNDMWLLLLKRLGGTSINLHFAKILLQNHAYSKDVLQMRLLKCGFEIKIQGDVITAKEITHEAAVELTEEFDGLDIIRASVGATSDLL